MFGFSFGGGNQRTSGSSSDVGSSLSDDHQRGSQTRTQSGSGTGRLLDRASGTQRGTQAGTQTSSWGALAPLMERLNPLLGAADRTFLGGAGAPRTAAGVSQAQGDIQRAGGGGLQDLLQERARGVLGADNRDATLKGLAADDIQGRVAAMASGRGRYGSPAHQGMLARELGRFEREWEQDKFGRDIAGLRAGGEAAGAAREERFAPLERYGSLLQRLTALGGQQRGATAQDNTQTSSTNRQQDTAEQQQMSDLAEMISQQIGKTQWDKKTDTYSKVKTDGFEFSL